MEIPLSLWVTDSFLFHLVGYWCFLAMVSCAEWILSLYNFPIAPSGSGLRFLSHSLAQRLVLQSYDDGLDFLPPFRLFGTQGSVASEDPPRPPRR